MIDLAKILQFLARDRTRISARSRAYTRGDPLSSAILDFYTYNKNTIEKLGFEKIIIRARSSNGDIYYSLSDSGGHIPQPTTQLARLNNLHTVRSKSIEMDEDLSYKTDQGFKVQVVVYSVDLDASHKQAIRAFCNFLVNDFVYSKKQLVSDSIDRGVSDIGSLYQRARDQSIQPGTFAVKMTRILAKSLGAKLCAVAIPHENSLYLEYATSNAPAKRGKPFVIGGRRIQIMRDDEYQKYIVGLSSTPHTKIDPNSNLHKTLGRALADTTSFDFAERDRIILSPVVYDKQTLAIVLFVFDSTSFSSFSAGSSLVDRACKNFASLARYLHQRRVQSMIVDPIFRSRDTVVNKATCFLMMPFGETWSDTVSKILRGVMSEEGVSTVRADEMHGENIMEDVWGAIVKSEYMIADVTGKNPNVYYELGIGHTIGKKILLITQNVDDIPFDTRHLRHIVYSNDLTGFDSIKNGVKGFLAR